MPGVWVCLNRNMDKLAKDSVIYGREGIYPIVTGWVAFRVVGVACWRLWVWRRL